MKRSAIPLVTLLVVLSAATAFAGVITDVTPDPKVLKVGDKTTVTVGGALGTFTTCRVYLMLGTDQTTTRFVDATSFPVKFEGVSFTKPGPGPNSTAFIHTWTGTTGPNPCDGQGKDATVTVTAVQPAGPVITKVTPSPASVKVGEKVKITVDGSLGSYTACRVYLMLGTDQSTTQNVDVTAASNFPRTFEVSFTKPGPGPNNTAFIHTWTGTSGPNPCGGHSKDATVTVKPADAPKMRPQPQPGRGR